MSINRTESSNLSSALISSNPMAFNSPGDKPPFCTFSKADNNTFSALVNLSSKTFVKIDSLIVPKILIARKPVKKLSFFLSLINFLIWLVKILFLNAGLVVFVQIKTLCLLDKAASIAIIAGSSDICPEVFCTKSPCSVVNGFPSAL